MKRLLFIILCLLLACSAALAEPMVTANGYTAYLGESNHLYLRDPLGVTKVLRYPISDIVSINDTQVYAIAQDGRLFGIRLDGTQTLILAEKPTEADIAAVAAAPVYELSGTTLYVIKPNGGKLLLSSNALAAAANDDRLFFIEKNADGTTEIKAILLDNITSLTLLAPIPTSLGQGVAAPLSMTATDDALTIVADDHSLRVMSLIDNSQVFHQATSELTAKAITLGMTIYRYVQNADGSWSIEANDSLPTLTLVDAAATTSVPRYFNTLTPTPSPSPTPTPTPTRTPTAKPKATSTPEPEEEYPRLDYGDKGSAVRSLQKRLKALGYPVGTVDGSWGKNTQLAVNLFQCAIGYKERSYASSAMQEKLYSRSAPEYDPYAPLREGDSGTDVKLMQQALFDLGYLGTDEEEEVDGKYGQRTTQAVFAFQAAVGSDILDITGEADADTLMVLFSDNPPRNPALSQPTDPNYPELILPGTPDNPVVPDITTNTDLVIFFTPDQT